MKRRNSFKAVALAVGILSLAACGGSKPVDPAMFDAEVQRLVDEGDMYGEIFMVLKERRPALYNEFRDIAVHEFSRGRPAREGGRGVADNPPLLTPAGRFHLTVADWARFVRVFMHDEFLSSKTIDRLLELPPDGRGMAMGWADGDRLGVSHAMQGSNTMWAATALLDRDVGLASMVVINDGRTRVLATSAQLAGVVLDRARR